MIYFRGSRGVAIDYERALRACKIGAALDNAVCVILLSRMLSYEKYGVGVDYEQAAALSERILSDERFGGIMSEERAKKQLIHCFTMMGLV